MKKILIFSLLCLQVLAACQPVDEKINDPRLNNFRGFNKNKGSAQGANTLRIGYFATAALLMEKEVEAVQIARLALSVPDTTKNNYKSETKDANLHLSSASEPLLYSHEGGSFKGQVAKNLLVKQDGSILDVTGEKLRQSVDRQDRKNFLNWFESKYALHLQESTVPGEVEITVVSEGSWMMGMDKVPPVSNNWKVEVRMTVERASLATDKVRVIRASARSEMKAANNPRVTTVTISGVEHEIKYNGQCYSLNGSSVIETDKTKKNVVYVDSSATVTDSKFVAPAASCEERPTLDLSRAFVF